uniref:helix-turn-helix domain-containing protein n=1 Tax=Rhodococcus erythropolis TaxID=1833 RepID=UPI00117B30D5
MSGAVEYIYETHRLTVKPSMVRQAVRDGTLPAYRIGREFHFAPKDLDEWLDSLRVRGWPGTWSSASRSSRSVARSLGIDRRVSTGERLGQPGRGYGPQPLPAFLKRKPRTANLDLYGFGRN